ncbi:MAG: hypothetical protein WDN28_33015 [Chthoniobacter sp.]
MADRLALVDLFLLFLKLDLLGLHVVLQGLIGRADHEQDYAQHEA